MKLKELFTCNYIKMKINFNEKLLFFLSILIILLIFKIYLLTDEKATFNDIQSYTPSMVHITVNEDSYIFSWLTSSVPDKCYLKIGSTELLIAKYSKYLNHQYIYKSFINKSELQNIEKYIIKCIKNEIPTSREFFIKQENFNINKAIFLADFSTSRIGDKNNNQHTQILKPNILEMLKIDYKDVSAIWHLGDIAYDLFSNNGLRGFEFLIDIEPFASKIPYIAVVGNHEIKNNFKSFMTLFENGLYFIQTVNCAKIIAISSEFDYYLMKPHLFPYCNSFFQYLKQKQEKWLKETLENIDRILYPWVIIVAHKPLYCSLNEESAMIMEACTLHAEIMRNAFEDIFIQYMVDLAIYGHIHLYERTYPLAYWDFETSEDTSKFINPSWPIHIVNGVAGNLEGKNIVFTIPKETEKWNVVMKESLGYGILTIHNHTHLQYEQISFGKTQWDDPFQDFYKSKRVDDSLWILKVNNTI